MRKRQSKHGQSLWYRLLARKWVQVKRRAEHFSADEAEDSDEGLGGHAPRRGNALKRSKISKGSPRSSSTDDVARSPPVSMLIRKSSEMIWTNYIDTQQLRLLVGTWNVAGKVPSDDMSIHDWFGFHEPADIYVIGLQEIVPLNPGNVLGSEDGISAAKWDAIIGETLNQLPGHSKVGRRESSSVPSSPASVVLLQEACTGIEAHLARHSFGVEGDLDRMPVLASRKSSQGLPAKAQQPYVRIASKQMVGIFVSVWMRRKLHRHVKAVRVASVGCGVMGCLGNKGSVSVSLSLHQTNFCFVCSHLKSGNKEFDALRRNFDVTEILRRTRFSRSKKIAGMKLPETILAHDRIIWFGDLNYRLSLPWYELDRLVAKKDWETLLEKDQLKLEQDAGRVFEGWREGLITFAPTYKYIANSDLYTLALEKECGKRRAPAWCDRILWYGNGLKQLSYVRSESRHSDHRPVRAVFIVEVERFKQHQLRIVSPISKRKVELEVF